MKLEQKEAKAEAALLWLHGNAEKCGSDAANVNYMNEWVKCELSRLKRLYVGMSNAAAEDEARCHPEYLKALEARKEAEAIHETNRMKKTAAEGFIAYFQTSSSNARANV